MLTIFASSFMTATRTDPPAPPRPRRRWLPNGHWWLSRERD